MSGLMSVVTPCYNSAETIVRTLESVEKQAYPDMEHVIIDGGSTDGTLDILREYSAQVSYPVRITSEPDSGIYDAMNKGVRASGGELIGIINSDDWYEPGAFARIIDAYEKHKNSDDPGFIIYGAIRLYDGGKYRSMEFYHHDFLPDRMINHPGCFVSKGVYDKTGLFDTSYRSSADYDWMKRAYDAGAVFIPVEAVLANVSAGGMSSTNVGFRETLKLQRKWGRVSAPKYYVYTFKSYIGDIVHRYDKG